MLAPGVAALLQKRAGSERADHYDLHSGARATGVSLAIDAFKGSVKKPLANESQHDLLERKH